MSRQKDISVVIPVRDGAALLPGLFTSLERLRDSPREILIVDNGSRDATREVLREAPAGVRVLPAHERASSYYARNIGWRAAIGDVVAFTDADCRPTHEWLAGLRKPFEDPEVGAVSGPVVSEDPGDPWDRLADRDGLLDQAAFFQRRPWPAAATANLAVRRDVLGRLGGFLDDRATGADFELCWRLARDLGLRLALAPEATVRHRHRRSLAEVYRQALRNGRAAAWLGRAYPDCRASASDHAARLLRHLHAWGELVSYPIHRRREALIAPGFYLARDLGLLLGRWTG
ncbi:MAG: glycosyltransferase [Planctomycetota bacterium]